MSSSDLERLFGFDAEDLAANQNGALSPRQARYYRDLDISSNRFLLLAGVGLLAGAFFLLRRAVPAVLAGPADEEPILQLVCGGGLIVIAAWFVRGTFTRMNYTILSAEGPARLIETARSPGPGASHQDAVYHELALGDATFRIERDAFLKLEEGRPYRAYYIQLTRQNRPDIISIEALGEKWDRPHE